MIEKLKIILDEDNTTLISLLVDMAKENATSFCNLDNYDCSLDNIVIQMVTELYNKRGYEGINSVNFNGVSENYNDNYSQIVLKQLIKHRKLKSV